MGEEQELRTLVRRLALENAAQHGGKTMAGVVAGKVLAQRADLRQRAREVMTIAAQVADEVNNQSPDEQKRLLSIMHPEGASKTGVSKEQRRLPPLPNAEKYSMIHVRFCPNPDGALHLGSARAAILCDEYAQMYDGRFTLRFDDTDPKTKSPITEAYGWIREDLKWLRIDWDDEYYQSDRLSIYYGFARTLLQTGEAYVCTCRPEQFRGFVATMSPCPCRSLLVEEQLRRWEMMIDGGYKEGEAVVRIKTDLNHPNPAVRDWPALRIIDVEQHPHPRTGTKYRVWPLFAFCCGIDDHEIGITHVIRGKEHLTNSVRQSFLYKHLGWAEPEAVHYGRLRIVGTVLSKSKMREGIAGGDYQGWDDPRLGTLMALRRRGFLPETIRQLIVDVGPKPVDATISWSNIESNDRKLLDPVASRYFFVPEPIALRVTGLNKTFSATPRLHPGRAEHGHRLLEVKSEDGEAILMVSGRDLKLLQLGSFIRLMELFNVQVEAAGDQVIVARFTGESYQEARDQGAPLIQWVPADDNIVAHLVMPDASTVEGLVEGTCRSLKVDDHVQFERFGFARIDATDERIRAYYTHR
ncbi:glutamate--tRNA ligase [Candidatus Bathyarchaeota archaeon]|nr:glutamate--tRNA ligase [Candidatus Bathyarchaeota archaeon]